MYAAFLRTLIRRAGLVFLCASASLANAAATADDCDVVTDGLRAPIGSVWTKLGNLIVSETGTVDVPNSGRISIVSAEGTRRTLLDGLPQGTNAAGGDASGPNGLTMKGCTVYVAIGQGDSVILGPVPGSNAAEPQRFLAAFQLDPRHSSQRRRRATDPRISADRTAAIGQKVTLSNGGGDRISIELIVDFPDYESEPLAVATVDKGEAP